MNPVSDDAWSPWLPCELASRLKQASGLWYVVGGWALDLWHGRQTREHEDLEFAILPESGPEFREILKELDFFTVHAGVIEYLEPGRSPPPHVSQLWGLDPGNARWRVDMMLEGGTPSTWIYKRDVSIHAPRSGIVRISETGIPYMAPAAVLLFKAKYLRDKDEADFARALPRLDPAERETLRRWLELVHPNHQWLAAL
ncbi:nucleotidyltransferase domain-containing protein [Rhizobium rhizogenes]|uniref:nucleotidyltransferase domain-containing protein n=1 Tax=Rhizobium rhizogenes TaxID=359 RepID=UPI001573CD1F|nr:amino acid transporter [Rhizobium rhizogenes]NTF44466.1 amino acid transporter [Rhizobium rhizogenes]